MNRLIRKAWAKWREPIVSRRGPTILAWAAMTALAVYSVADARGSVARQREIESDRTVAACVQRSESREQLRGVLLGLADRLGAGDATVMVISDYLDEQYPELDPALCTDPPPVIIMEEP